MSRFDPRDLARAFAGARTPSLADVLAQMGDNPALSATRRRDLASALRRVASAIGWPLAEAPADPAWLRPRIAKVAPAAIGLRPKSWTNIVSNAHAALTAAGVRSPAGRRLDDLGPDWQPLWDAVLASRDPSLAPALGRLVRFLDSLGIAPGDVEDAHAEAYETALAMNELRKDPALARRAAAYGWNAAVTRIPGWPQQRLTVPSRDRRYALALERFPESFAAELAAFVDAMAHPDPLDPAARTAAQRPATVGHRRAQVLRLASALVHDGMAVESITGLGVLTDPAHARRGLSWMLRRNGDATSPGIADTAVMLTVLGRHLGVPGETATALKALSQRLALPAAQGLTEKNRARLRPLGLPAVQRRLVQLPETLERRAIASEQPYRAALDMEIAVAVAILLVCPIRRNNLAGLRLDRHLSRDGKGLWLVFPAGEVKNRRVLEYPLPARVAALIDRHMASFRPRLVGPGSPFLFPRRDGAAPIEPSSLSRRITAAIRREVGIEMNPHLFRHFAAMLVLDAMPGHYELVRRLLGHAALSSTLNAYAGFEAGTAARLFAELVERAGAPS